VIGERASRSRVGGALHSGLQLQRASTPANRLWSLRTMRRDALGPACVQCARLRKPRGRIVRSRCFGQLANSRGRPMGYSRLNGLNVRWDWASRLSERRGEKQLSASTPAAAKTRNATPLRLGAATMFAKPLTFTLFSLRLGVRFISTV
jgi:hypothetical protein